MQLKLGTSAAGTDRGLVWTHLVFVGWSWNSASSSECSNICFTDFHVSRAFSLLSTCLRESECVHVPFSKKEARLWLLLMGCSTSLRRLTQFLPAATSTFTSRLQRVGGAARKRAQRARRGAFCQLKKTVAWKSILTLKNVFYFESNSEILPKGKSPKALGAIRTFLSNANTVLLSFADRLCRSFRFF